MDLDRLQQVLARLRGYLNFEWHEVLIELVIIWVVVFIIFRFLRGTRGARVIKGMALVLVMATLVIQVLGREESFDRLNFLYTNFLGFASLALVIVFQPELRRALVRLGETRIFSRGQLRKARVVEELVAAVGYLSKNKVGALVAIERDIQLGSVIEAGTALTPASAGNCSTPSSGPARRSTIWAWSSVATASTPPAVSSPWPRAATSPRSSAHDTAPPWA